MTILSNLLNTLFSLYTHNGPVLFYSLGICAAIAHLLRRPSRRAVFALLGFGLLLFSFEYQKHFVAHFHTHLVLQITDPTVQPREYSLATRVTQQVLPIAMDIVGWGMLFIALFLKQRVNHTRDN